MKMQFKEGNIGLKPFTREDLKLSNFKDWFNDETCTRFTYRGRFPISDSDIEANFLEIEKHKKIEWAIYWLGKAKDNKGNEAEACVHIGIVSLENLNFIDSSAEVIIFIGEKDFWKKGVGTIAFNYAIKYGFERLGLHRLYAGTHECNIGMRKIFKKCNMSFEGIKRQSYKRDEFYYDTVHFSILEDLFFKKEIE